MGEELGPIFQVRERRKTFRRDRVWRQSHVAQDKPAPAILATRYSPGTKEIAVKIGPSCGQSPGQ